MTQKFLLRDRTVSKGAAERGEIGGLERVSVFDSEAKRNEALSKLLTDPQAVILSFNTATAYLLKLKGKYKIRACHITKGKKEYFSHEVDSLVKLGKTIALYERRPSRYVIEEVAYIEGDEG